MFDKFSWEDERYRIKQINKINKRKETKKWKK